MVSTAIGTNTALVWACKAGGDSWGNIRSSAVREVLSTSPEEERPQPREDVLLAALGMLVVGPVQWPSRHGPDLLALAALLLLAGVLFLLTALLIGAWCPCGIRAARRAVVARGWLLEVLLERPLWLLLVGLLVGVSGGGRLLLAVLALIVPVGLPLPLVSPLLGEWRSAPEEVQSVRVWTRSH